MPLPSKRNPEDIARILEGWFADQLGHDCSIDNVGIPSGTGMSSETILFTLHHGSQSEEMVARIRPDMNDWPVFPVYDLSGQSAAMRFVATHSDVPVPTIRFEEASDELLGAPFFVMDRVRGDAPPDMMPYTFGGSFLDGYSPSELSEMQRNAASVLARIHAIDIDGRDLGFAPSTTPDAVSRLLGEWRTYFDWARDGDSFPVIEDSLEWLQANAPRSPGRTVLSWGDARVGNMLFARTTPVAVLDWEMVNVGPAGIDVGWMVFMHTFFQTLATGFGVPGFPDFLTADGVLRDYEAAGGAHIDDIHWYEVFAGMRFAAIYIRTTKRRIAYGEQEEPANPEDMIMHRDLLRQMIS